MRKGFLFLLALMLLAVTIMVSCDPDNASNGDNPTPVNPEDNVNMTENYREGRSQIYQLSGIWILALPDKELLGSSDLGADHGVVCFDILSDDATFDLLFDDLKTKFGRNPDGGDSDGGWWNIERTIEGTVYVGSLDIIHDTANGAVYINCVMSPLAASYATARAQFQTDTGILLPAICGLEVDYGAAGMFDIVDGDNLTYATYGDFYDFFVDLYGACDVGYPDGAGGASTREAQWTVDGRWIQVFWNGSGSPGIFINVVD